MMEVLSIAALATVQDLGRNGCRRFGVGTSGAMDRVALAAGNVMLGNEASAAGIEIPVMPFRLGFHARTEFALTGADAGANLDGNPVPPWWAMTAEAGQSLTLTSPRHGCRCYLAVAGGIDVPIILGSRSTHLRGAFGGLSGQWLKKGDLIGSIPACGSDRRRPLPIAGFGVAPPEVVLPLGEASDEITTVRVLPAAEYPAFRSESRRALWDQVWRITPQSDRTGYRLDGPSLSLTKSIELRSHGIVPGVIQVPDGGRPIIQLADAATAGGYPKIGTVIEADLWRLAQARPGSGLRFVETTYLDGRRALDDCRRFLDDLSKLAALYRSGTSTDAEPRGRPNDA